MASAPPRIAVPPLLDPRALDGHDPAAQVIDLAGESMGTGWRVRFAARPGLDCAAIREAIEERLEIIVAQMSHWWDGSLLCRFNRASAGSWTPLPHDFATVMKAGLRLAERTFGAFDPAIGRITDLYGLGPRAAEAAPNPSQIADMLAVSGWHRLAFDEDGQRLYQPGGTWLDLSGIAKGYGVDAVIDCLERRGLRHVLVEIGGECSGRGIRPDGDPWWVDLETPPGLGVAPFRIALHQIAVATSGNYVRGDHTLDPRTGEAVRNGIVSASVLHLTAMEADVWATALTVLGPDEAAEVARREHLAVRILMAEDSGVREWISPAMEQML
jgi:thiamine biosynthesis lipoprotein